MHLILASASPRRSELLRLAGFTCDVRPSHVEETLWPGEPAVAHVRRLAEAKARAAIAHSAGTDHVLGADTVVVVDDTILGKPADGNDAVRMLRMLSGRAHDVLTGVCLTSPSGEMLVDHESTTVEFAPLTDEEIGWYVATGEASDKAGGYAIQGFASRFITRISGSYSNVVGLPVARVYDMCKRAGLLIS